MNKPKAPNLSLIRVRDLSQTLRDALETGAVVAVLMAVTTLAVVEAERYFARAQIAEAAFVASTVRQEIIAYRAEHGEWPVVRSSIPNSAFDIEPAPGRLVAELELGQQGSFTAVFDDTRPIPALRGKRLSMRPLTVAANPSAPVSWVCGAHRFPDGLSPGGDDKTTIDARLLPASCRGD